MKYRIVRGSNFDNESVSESWSCETRFDSKEDAQLSADALNEAEGDDFSYYFHRVVREDHTLYTWEP